MNKVIILLFRLKLSIVIFKNRYLTNLHVHACVINNNFYYCMQATLNIGGNIINAHAIEHFILRKPVNSPAKEVIID